MRLLKSYMVFKLFIRPIDRKKIDRQTGIFLEKVMPTPLPHMKIVQIMIVLCVKKRIQHLFSRMTIFDEKRCHHSQTSRAQSPLNPFC